MSTTVAEVHTAPARGRAAAAPRPTCRCGVTETARMLSELARSCPDCLGPVAAAFRDLSAPGAFDLVVRWATQADQRGGCRHAAGPAQLLRRSLAAYPDEIEAHAEGICTSSAAGRRPVRRG
ncbi:hypothetical protein [Streptacidiphilus cavernicola]|uniref:Uncharacterized protein n=1 Tax=Streptacidiphilus cavernicola TaxID=3342716 RepID=A0ABV6VZ25_9ACTN